MFSDKPGISRIACSYLMRVDHLVNFVNAARRLYKYGIHLTLGLAEVRSTLRS